MAEITPHPRRLRPRLASTVRDVADVFDVVVVGGRCAGAPLATLLAERGLSVCVADLVAQRATTHRRRLWRASEAARAG